MCGMSLKTTVDVQGGCRSCLFVMISGFFVVMVAAAVQSWPECSQSAVRSWSVGR